MGFIMNDNQHINVLNKAIDELNDTKGINFKGKDYTQVKDRVEIFRRAFGVSPSIITTIEEKENTITAETKIIFDEIVVANGISQKVRGANPILKAAAVEMAETASVGRALAKLSLHGGEFASSNEMENAQDNEKIIDEKKVESLQSSEKIDDLQWEEEKQKILQAVSKANHMGQFRKALAPHEGFINMLKSTNQKLYQELDELLTKKEKELSNGTKFI